jgi:hypothetical protein
MKSDKQLTQELNNIYKKNLGDNESLHSDADDFLCNILEQLGYIKLVKKFKKFQETDFWYS